MAFADDFPLNPPPLQEDWSQPADRNAYDSLAEVRNALREVERLLEGLDRQTIPLPDGSRVEVLARNAGEDDEVSNKIPFNLVSVPDTEGQWKVENPSRIYTSYIDLTAKLTIEKVADGFALGAGDLVYLKLTTPDAPVLELMGGAAPSGWPKAVKFAAEPAPPATEEAYFLLWEVLEGTLPKGKFGKQLNENLYALRIERSSDLVLIWGAEELDETYRSVPIPLLLGL
jgi:hypothetical protein